MKSIVILYNENNSPYKNEKIFNGKSAVEVTNQLFADNVSTVNGIFTINQQQNITSLLSEINKIASSENANFVIFSFNDVPFINKELTEKLIHAHTQYKSEYTFADGYPYGFTPELIDCGTLRILEELSKTSQSAIGESEVSRDWIFKLLKTDINSFEVETVLAPVDWRLYRFAFHCGRKENFLQCKALKEAAKDETNAVELSNIAMTNPGCLKTVPGFYNIQIADKVSSNSIYLPYNTSYEQKYSLNPVNATKLMSYEDFASLVDKIAAFSECGVISLSAWGEPLSNPNCLKMIEKVLSYKGLSVFIETDGLLVTEDFCTSLEKIISAAEPRKNGWQKIMVAVTLDSVTAKTYTTLHKDAEEQWFQSAINAVSNLQKVIPGCVYPQFVRMNENEAELESFYRYWNEKSNPSGGNLIIQKYDDFAGLLPQCKPADLSPLDRNPCWHTRRDMTILSNGDVPSCRQYVLSGIVGNVFAEDLETVWHKTDEILNQHINKKYNEKCEKCDEHYTFNF